MSSAATRPVILTAAPVGFTSEGAVDYQGSRHILEFIARSGTDGAFILGTTAEFPALTEEERRRLTELSFEVLAGKRIVTHVGAASAYQVKRLIGDVRHLGGTTVAALTPYYLPASEQAILDFYDDVCEAAGDLDVYAYLFAQRTGNTVGPDLLARLTQIPNLVGAKVSGESLATMDRLRAAVGDDFRLLTGGDRDIAQVTAHGLTGVVSGVASVLPQPFVRMAEAVAADDQREIDRLQETVDDAVDAVAGDPERMKVGLALQGIAAGTSRMALDKVTEDVRARLATAVETHGLE